MAVDIATLVRQRLVAAKIEATTGTAETLADADTIPLLFDAVMEGNTDVSDRPAQGTLTKLPGVAGARGGRFTGRTELMGSGTTTLPPWTNLLQACGFANASGVFTPLTGSGTTLTIGLLRPSGTDLLAGAMGTFTLRGQAGMPASMEWDFTGVHTPQINYSALAQSIPTIQPPRVAAITLAVGGAGYVVSDFALAWNAQIAYREDVTKIAGYRAVTIVDRNPTLTLNLEAVPIATKNWNADFLASTTVAFNCVIGTVAHNIITVAAPALAHQKHPTKGDKNGISQDQLTFTCTSTTPDGELTITLT